MPPILSFQDVIAGYDEGTVLDGVSLDVPGDSTVALLGRNGVGKTTTLRTAAGIVHPREGEVHFDGTEITGYTPDQIYRRGLVLVPEHRGVFPDLTVRENLRVPIIREGTTERSLNELYELFPALADLESSKGKHLSGGEQQMLTIARALRSDPKLLLLDEPAEGLAPQIVEDVLSIIDVIVESGTSVFLVEQNVELALNIADYVYVMDSGRIVFDGEPGTVREEAEEVERYLGVHQTGSRE